MHWVGDAIQPSHAPLPLLLLPSIFPNISVFSNELALCIRSPKYWNLSISPSNEYPGLISFRIDWFDLLAVQGTLKSLLQHSSSKHQFFSLQSSLYIEARIERLKSVTCEVLTPVSWSQGVYSISLGLVVLVYMRNESDHKKLKTFPF